MLITTEASEITVAGMAHDGESAETMVRETQPDVVLMDLALLCLDGVEATRRILAENPEVRILAFTGYTDSEMILKAIQAGLRGVCLKATTISDLVEAIRRVACGETVLPDAFVLTEAAPARAVVPRMEWASLSPVEIRILDLAAKGYNDDTIRSLLRIAQGTCRNYRRSIREKLGVDDWHQAVVAYMNKRTSAGR